MAGVKINNYNQSDSNILELQLTSDQSFKGKHQVSLTNYDNTSLPAVAAGSVIEVNGALYKFTSEEAITGSPSDGTVYIYIDPSTITAVFTNTAPAWSDSKQGWYGTTTTANCRYIEFYMTKATSTYTGKNKYVNRTMINAVLTTTTKTGTGTKIIDITSKTLDYKSELNVSTSTFTASESGSYRVFFTAYVTNSAATNGSQIQLWKNGSGYITIITMTNNTSRQVTFNNIIELTGGNTLSFYIGNQLIDVTTAVSTYGSCICIEKIV